MAFRGLLSGLFSGQHQQSELEDPGAFEDRKGYNYSHQPNELTNYVSGTGYGTSADAQMGQQQAQQESENFYSNVLSQLSPRYSRANNLYGAAQNFYNGNYMGGLNQLSGGKIGSLYKLGSRALGNEQAGNAIGASATGAGASKFGAASTSTATGETQGLIEALLSFFY